MQSRLGRVSAELASSGILVPEDRKLLEEHAAFVRETEKELTAVAKEKAAAPPPAPDAALRDENDSIPKLSRRIRFRWA